MKGPESYVKSDVRKYLKALGVYFFSNTTFGYGGSGQPDITGCIQGRFVGIELKAEGKEPTALQYRRIADIRKSGGCAFWATSVDQVMRTLKKEFALAE